MSAHNVVIVGAFPEDPAFIKGGIQASVYGLSRALSRRKDVGNVKVISLPVRKNTALKSTRVEGIKVIYLNAPFLFLSSSIVYLPKILREIRQYENPVLHIHGTGLTQAALCAIARIKGLSFVWTLLGLTERETLQAFRDRKSVGNAARYIFYRSLERLCLRTAPHIVVITDYVRGAVRTSNTVHVIPQGIFMEELASLRDIKPQEQPLVLCVGVFSPRKGHHVTIKAFAELLKEIPEARLVIAGSLTDLAYYRFLEKRVGQLGIAGSVDLCPNLPRHEILELLGRARIFALYSREESQGIVLCEALAAGVPVVASRVGGIPFVVTDQKDGILTPYGDIPAFSAAMIKLLKNDEYRARLAQQALASSARFDWTNIAPAVLEVYRLAGSVPRR